MASNPYDMPAGEGFPDGYEQPVAGPMAPGAPEMYYGTIACTIGIRLPAESPDAANRQMLTQVQQLMDRLGNVEGFTPQKILLLDPDTGLAVEAFLTQLELRDQ
jgi:hypothetical protein